MSIVVSGSGSHRTHWEGLQAIAAQDVADPVEVVIVQEAGDLLLDSPMLRLASSDSRDPWARKTAGARMATAPIVAFLNADCVPENGWLRSMLEVFRFFPEVAVVRGPVEKAGIDWRKLLPERRIAGPVASTADNNVAFRRDTYLEYPFPEGMGSEAVRLQSAALRRAHYVVWCNPTMQAMRGSAGRKPPVSQRLRSLTAVSR